MQEVWVMSSAVLCRMSKVQRRQLASFSLFRVQGIEYGASLVPDENAVPSTEPYCVCIEYTLTGHLVPIHSTQPNLRLLQKHQRKEKGKRGPLA